MTNVDKLLDSLDENSINEEIKSYFEIGSDNYMNYAREKLREETGSNTSSARSYFIQMNDTLLPMKTIARMAQVRKNVSSFNPNSITFAPALERLGYVIHHDSTARIGKNASATTREGNERNYQWRLARPEQARFRQNVLKHFGQVCILTNCRVVEAIEAAHIIPHAEAPNFLLENGIPLRRDVHRLFDCHLVRINPESFEVFLDDNIKTEYESQIVRWVSHPKLATYKSRLKQRWDSLQ